MPSLTVTLNVAVCVLFISGTRRSAITGNAGSGMGTSGPAVCTHVKVSGSLSSSREPEASSVKNWPSSGAALLVDAAATGPSCPAGGGGVGVGIGGEGAGIGGEGAGGGGEPLPLPPPQAASASRHAESAAAAPRRTVSACIISVRREGFVIRCTRQAVVDYYSKTPGSCYVVNTLPPSLPITKDLPAGSGQVWSVRPCGPACAIRPSGQRPEDTRLVLFIIRNEQMVIEVCISYVSCQHRPQACAKADLEIFGACHIQIDLLSMGR
jgi:hypothetical protein